MKSAQGAGLRACGRGSHTRCRPGGFQATARRRIPRVRHLANCAFSPIMISKRPQSSPMSALPSLADRLPLASRTGSSRRALPRPLRPNLAIQQRGGAGVPRQNQQRTNTRTIMREAMKRGIEGPRKPSFVGRSPSRCLLAVRIEGVSARTRVLRMCHASLRPSSLATRSYLATISFAFACHDPPAVWSAPAI